jgi:hypothetical protein
MDRRIIPMTASRKEYGESRKETSSPGADEFTALLGASSRSDLDAGLPRLVMGSRLVFTDAAALRQCRSGWMTRYRKLSGSELSPSVPR